MSLNQRVTAEFSTCTPSAPPTPDLSIQTNWTGSRVLVVGGSQCKSVSAIAVHLPQSICQEIATSPRLAWELSVASGMSASMPERTR
jgi:hypothetical protein